MVEACVGGGLRWTPYQYSVKPDRGWVVEFLAKGQWGTIEQMRCKSKRRIFTRIAKVKKMVTPLEPTGKKVVT